MRRGWLRRAGIAVVAASLITIGGPRSLPLPGRAAGLATVDPLLAGALATAAPTTSLLMLGDLTHVPTPSDVAILTGLGAQVTAFHTLPVVAIQAPAAAVPSLQAAGVVTSLWLNHGVELLLHESVPLIHADQVRTQLGYDGRGIGIAIVDSGIDGTHADLKYPTKTVQNVQFVGYTKQLPNNVLVQPGIANTDTTSGHGTVVADIAAGDGTASTGYYTGVAPGASLIGVGAGQATEMIATVAGLDWIVENHVRYGIRVANCSWGDGKITYDPNDPINVATKAVHDAGVVVVMAAGNDGSAEGTLNRYAFAPWVTVVGGGDKLGQLASYSSRGDGVHNPTVIAPGSYIAAARASTGFYNDTNSTPLDLTDPANPRVMATQYVPYYTVGLGTSFAAPHVSGVVALMLQAAPSLTPDQVKALLAQTATPMAGCPASDCGAGYVDAYAAVRAARVAADVPPTATITATPAVGGSPLAVTLDASGSSASAGRVITSYSWDVDGNGTVDATTTTPQLQHTYTTGRWTARVQATDDLGVSSAWASVTVTSDNPPTARATAPTRLHSGSAGSFDGSASTAASGATLVAWTWTFSDGTTASGATVSHTYTVHSTKVQSWRLVVTDNFGRTAAIAGHVKVVVPSSDSEGGD